MAGSIADFLGNFKTTGVAKTSHFDVAILASSADFARTLSFRCEAAEIPGRQLATVDNKIYGPVYKTPVQSIYAETSLRFIETGEMDIRVFFENWMDAIWDSKTNKMRYPDQWMYEMSVTQYDMVPQEEKGTNLRKILTCVFKDSFPININQMATDWTDDGFHRTQVVLAYRSYKLIHHTRPPEPIITGTAEVLPID
jgi:hypothetical protein